MNWSNWSNWGVELSERNYFSTLDISLPYVPPVDSKTATKWKQTQTCPYISSQNTSSVSVNNSKTCPYKLIPYFIDFLEH